MIAAANLPRHEKYTSFPGPTMRKPPGDGTFRWVLDVFIIVCPVNAKAESSTFFVEEVRRKTQISHLGLAPLHTATTLWPNFKKLSRHHPSQKARRSSSGLSNFGRPSLHHRRFRWQSHEACPNGHVMFGHDVPRTSEFSQVIHQNFVNASTRTSSNPPLKFRQILHSKFFATIPHLPSILKQNGSHKGSRDSSPHFSTLWDRKKRSKNSKDVSVGANSIKAKFAIAAKATNLQITFSCQAASCRRASLFHRRGCIFLR